MILAYSLAFYAFVIAQHVWLDTRAIRLRVTNFLLVVNMEFQSFYNGTQGKDS